MTSMMSYRETLTPSAATRPQQRPRQLSFASADNNDDDDDRSASASPSRQNNASNNSSDNDNEDNWQPVMNRRRTSFDETNPDDKTPKSKAARKNERRRERRRREKQLASPSPADDYRLVPSSNNNSNNNTPTMTPMTPEMEEEICRAIAESLKKNEAGNTENDDPRYKKLRNLRKKLSSAQRLTQQQETLDDNQLEKINRIPLLENEILEIENELKLEQEQRLQQELKVKEEENNKQQKQLQQWADLEQGKIVSGFGKNADNEFDEFACSICAGPLEAATWAIPCKHVFCRACLESAIKSAAEYTGGDPSSCACPLCRTCLYDVQTGQVKTRKADTVRRRMKKRSCTCRCGTVISLNGLRGHLRVCGSGAPELFGDDEKKKFGHEFEQPVLDEEKCEAYRKKQGFGKKNRRNRSGSVGSAGGGGGGSSGRNRSGSGGVHVSVPRGYDEAEAYQRALLLSLEER